MIEVFLKIFFFSMIIFIILSLYFHYRVQYVMFFKIRPFLKQHGIKNRGILPLRYGEDFIMYGEICCKNDLQSDFSGSVKINEKRSWIFIIISSVFYS
jgi:hypothetical protein